MVQFIAQLIAPNTRFHSLQSHGRSFPRVAGGGWRVAGGGGWVAGGGWRVQGNGWRVEGNGWRVEGNVWRVESNGWRVEGNGKTPLWRLQHATGARDVYGTKHQIHLRLPHDIFLRHKECRVYQRSEESKIRITKTPEAVYYHPFRSCAPLATRENIEEGRLVESNKQLLWHEFGYNVLSSSSIRSTVTA